MSDYFDTHCHLQAGAFDVDRDEVIARAAGNSIRILTIGTDLQSSRRGLALAEQYENVYAAVGIHPNDSAKAKPGDLADLRELAEHPRTLAIGETGLDWYRDRALRQTQYDFLGAQLDLAMETRLPVLLHARQSGKEVLDAVTPFLNAGGVAVWHCFVAGKREIRALLEQALASGLYLGIGGMVTYEDQKSLRAVMPEIPDRHLLLDTDSPYIIPRPRTLERNEPISCIRITEELAKLRGVNPEDIARITTRNACRFLNLPLPHDRSAAIAYAIRNSLYLSLTNACNNNCVFCARQHGFLVKGHDIRLDHDPDAEEVISAMGGTDGYDEVVFCGYGEPTLRLETLKAVAEELRRRGQRVRLNTNGLGNLAHGRDIVPELKGRIDAVSISLNSADPSQYAALCRSDYGAEALSAARDFARRCVAAGVETTLTVIGLPEIDIDAARRVAHDLGADFRVRSHVDAG